MSSLIGRCNTRFSKEDMAQTENLILSFFGYDMSFTDISLSYLAQILGKASEDKF